MTQTDQYAARPPKPLLVIVLADTSGTMSVDGKIDVLNRAIEDMARDFASMASFQAEVHLSVVTFGGAEATVVQPPVPASEFRWTPVSAQGKTPLGAALTLMTDVLEDRDQVPSRSYRPILVLVSDGRPNDKWEPPLARLLESERASKTFRFAIAVGADCRRDILERFVGDSTGCVVDAHQAAEISEFFNLLTMSVSRALASGDYATRTSFSLETLTDADDALDA